MAYTVWHALLKNLVSLLIALNHQVVITVLQIALLNERYGQVLLTWRHIIVTSPANLRIHAEVIVVALEVQKTIVAVLLIGL